MDLQISFLILNICQTHLMPWLATCFIEMEEEIMLGLLEIFHSILILLVPYIIRNKYDS